jgi:hypothetical protein
MPSYRTFPSFQKEREKNRRRMSDISILSHAIHSKLYNFLTARLIEGLPSRLIDILNLRYDLLRLAGWRFVSIE